MPRRALALLLATPACAHATPLPLVPESGSFAPAAALAPPARLRLVTYNVHFGEDPAGIAAALGAHPTLAAADVLLVQEIRHYRREGASRARRLAEALHMHYVYVPARAVDGDGTHGQAVLSRFPIAACQVLELPYMKLGAGSERRIAVVARLDIAGRPLLVYNVHLDTRLNPDDRIAQLAPVADTARGAPGPAIVGGDFNTNAVLWLGRLLPIARIEQAPLVDAFMRARGYDAPTTASGPTLTTRLLPMRLDSFYTHGLAAAGSGVAREVKVSDHVPVWLDVKWTQ
jgi:endonuclease/exonuclease/phosphatase family metal-dependent hydrolase